MKKDGFDKLEVIPVSKGLIEFYLGGIWILSLERTGGQTIAIFKQPRKPKVTMSAVNLLNVLTDWIYDRY